MKGKLGVVVLAAGASQRLGQPKQLLPWKQGTLLEYVVDMALAVAGEPVFVVLGAERELIQPVLPATVKVVANPHWREGVASSIRESVETLERLYPESRGVLFLSCDQPLVRGDHLRKMLALFQRSEKTIMAATYAGTTGIPVIFSRCWFPTLRNLKGDQGAKVILRKNTNDVATLSLPEAQWDIDDWETYHRLQSKVMSEG
ncbi:MAG: NTP transferase domain-containing protein [Fidelibacterota bacterium]